MEFRGVFVFVILSVVICYVQSFPNPRDSTVVKAPDVTRIDDGSLAAVTKDNVAMVDNAHDNEQTAEKYESHEDTIPVTTIQNSILTPRQVSCKYEETTEDLVCQELCLPKGYSYGLCVGYKCSCY